MPTIDTYSYINGLSAAIYFVTCLLCGFQLSFGFPLHRQSVNNKLSHLVGLILIGMSCSAVCYILFAVFSPLRWLYYLGSTIDLVLFIGVACAGYLIYSNNQPSTRMFWVLALPFVAIALMYLLIPSFRHHLIDCAQIVLVVYYIYYGVLLHRREESLDDLYSNPYFHSVKWIRGVIALLIVWWVLRLIMLNFNFYKWYDTTIYIYMVGFVLFVFYKISNYGEPVSLETQKEIEQVKLGNVKTIPDISNPLQAALIALMEEKKLYLDPDLKVEDVVKELGTNTKYFSAMLRNDMKISFSDLINTYRVEESKILLKSSDDKLVIIAMKCGYHSVDTFSRNFFKIVGNTPADWRMQ